MSTKVNTHYDIALKSAKLHKWAEDAAKRVVAECTKRKITPLFAYRGMSGVTHATALTQAIYRLAPRFHFGVAYVRKSNEESHGISVETAYNKTKRYVLVFVDDFVCGGHTFRAVRDTMTNHWVWEDIANPDYEEKYFAVLSTRNSAQRSHSKKFGFTLI